MKKTLLVLMVVGALLALPATAFADVIRGTDGHPIGSMSNPGSAQGQANRSAQGTDMKFTHDGIHLADGFWD